MIVEIHRPRRRSAFLAVDHVVGGEHLEEELRRGLDHSVQLVGSRSATARRPSSYAIVSGTSSRLAMYRRNATR